MRWCRGVGDLLQMTNHVVILLAGSWDSRLISKVHAKVYLSTTSRAMESASRYHRFIHASWGASLQYYAVKCFILSHAHKIRRIYSGIGCNNIVLKF